MGAIKSHRDLDVWKWSMDFIVDIYRITEKFPKEESYGLSNQMRRAGVSVCSNIAEGAARTHSKEFKQFLYIALGSASELETQLEISFRLGYITSTPVHKEKLDRIRKMLIGLIRSINRDA